jgi:hypothetical protein
MRLKLSLTRRAHCQADVAQRFFVFMQKTPSYITSSNPRSNFYFFIFLHIFSCVDPRRGQLRPWFGAGEVVQGRTQRDQPGAGVGELGRGEIGQGQGASKLSRREIGQG